MKQSKISSTLVVLVIFLVLFTTFSILSVEARKNHSEKSKIHNQKKEKKNNGSHSNNSPAPAPVYGGGHQTHSTSFNIFSFGAKGDGACDDSKALLGAWKAACSVPGATLQIPSGFKFLINSINLQGPCMPRLTLQIDGTLLAPPRIGSWPKSSLFQWLNFKWVQNFIIQGSGTVDGQGSNWWKYSQTDCSKQNKQTKTIPSMKPTAMRFYSSNNVTVRGIKIINSPLCHLKFDDSQGVKINNITILAPENSLNTDGIHLQNTKDVEIVHSSIGSGDDCVSIQTGCSNIYIQHINCGPGHGISVGGLGKDKSVACVSDIIIDNIFMENTHYGARIKTWQGGLGLVHNVSFSNIHVSNVKVPIMIDQYYCDKGFCKNQTRAVAISGVKFDQIIGTYATKPIHLACSNSIPCTNIDLFNIQLKPSTGFSGLQKGLCWNSYGKSEAPLAPSSMDYCVRKESDFVRRISRSHEFSCQ
ncbi:hypothetical protein LIER_28740 [Lithospermum erythrorhizon]|uniref:Polygalacturonase n=1 Tax=Lithospermum erythrorhizon TaxID=34254 RepID=A0AAV3RH69_LITER